MTQAKGKSLTRDKDGLSERERRFVRSYLIDPNGVRAARAAGYLDRLGARRAKDLLRRQSIMAVIEKERKRQQLQFEVTHDSVVRELAKLAFANMADYTAPVFKTTQVIDGETGEVFDVEEATPDRIVDLSQCTRDQMAAIQEITSEVYFEGRGDDAVAVKKTKFKLASKKDSLVELAKILGMYKEESGGEIKVTVHGSLLE